MGDGSQKKPGTVGVLEIRISAQSTLCLEFAFLELALRGWDLHVPPPRFVALGKTLEFLFS
jgi:hypothetical protein